MWLNSAFINIYDSMKNVREQAGLQKSPSQWHGYLFTSHQVQEIFDGWADENNKILGRSKEINDPLHVDWRL